MQRRRARRLSRSKILGTLKIGSLGSMSPRPAFHEATERRIASDATTSDLEQAQPKGDDEEALTHAARDKREQNTPDFHGDPCSEQRDRLGSAPAVRVDELIVKDTSAAGIATRPPERTAFCRAAGPPALGRFVQVFLPRLTEQGMETSLPYTITPTAGNLHLEPGGHLPSVAFDDRQVGSTRT